MHTTPLEFKDINLVTSDLLLALDHSTLWLCKLKISKTMSYMLPLFVTLQHETNCASSIEQTQKFQPHEERFIIITGRSCYRSSVLQAMKGDNCKPSFWCQTRESIWKGTFQRFQFIIHCDSQCLKDTNCCFHPSLPACIFSLYNHQHMCPENYTSLLAQRPIQNRYSWRK